MVEDWVEVIGGPSLHWTDVVAVVSLLAAEETVVLIARIVAGPKSLDPQPGNPLG